MERSPNQFTAPMQTGGRHFKFFQDLDAFLVQQEADNAELHMKVEQNGIEGSEEQLIFDAFRTDDASE